MLVTVLFLLAVMGSGCGGEEPAARDPCKTIDDGFGLKCANVTSQFFSSVMFFSLNDDIASFTGEMKRLEIEQSNITSLQSSSFKGMPLLTYLIMANVSLREVERGAFEGLTRLKMVDLSHNDLASLPADTFRDTRLSHLDLEGNPNFRVPTSGPVLTAKRLRSLILKNCRLEHLSGSAFSATVDLSYLDLSDNLLATLPVELFAPLPRLDFVDLSRNRFATIDPRIFTSAPSYPTLPATVLLAGNPWTCHCSMLALIDWLARDPRSGTHAQHPWQSRLRDRTDCRKPEGATAISWNDPRLKELISC